MKLFRHFPSAFLTLAVTALLIGCASTGAPMPPSLELPKPVADLRAVRKGAGVYLAWTIPVETTDRQAIRHAGRAQICRSSQTAMSVCGAPVGELAQPLPAELRSQNKPGKRTQEEQASYSDTLPSDLLQNNRAGTIFYAVQIVNENRRGAGLSNQVQVSTAPTLHPPDDFKARLTADAVILTWRNVPTGEGDRALRHVYRIYRQQEGSNADTVVGEVELNESSQGEVQDHSFDWEKTYQYRATVVTIVPQPNKPDVQVEGEDTPSVKVVTHDVFPPGVPSGLQAVFSGVGQQPFVDLIWSPIPDADLVGYNVYRHEAGGQSVKINADPVKTPAFRDANVQSNRTYIYAVTSVDVRGNESALSEETSEKVP